MRSRVLGAALMVLAATVRPATAADVLQVVGSGTIAPGLGAVPAVQNFSFGGTALLFGTRGNAIVSCAVTGTGLADSATEGVGNLAGSCGPVSFSSCVYVRVGVDVTVACFGLVAAGVGHFAFLPVDVLPTTRYTLTGTMAAV